MKVEYNGSNFEKAMRASKQYGAFGPSRIPNPPVNNTR